MRKKWGGGPTDVVIAGRDRDWPEVAVAGDEERRRVTEPGAVRSGG